MNIGIVGYGFVGKAMKRMFPDAVVYDPFVKELATTKSDINACHVAFVCVPTNMAADGSCDTSIVEETLRWLKTPLVIIRSTIAPGTTDKLQKKYKGEIVFQPEYIGETTAHPLLNESHTPFMVLGGREKGRALAIEVYKTVYNASVKIQQMKALEAEIVKYMENTSIGTTVVFANEFYNICQAFGADYNTVREGYLADPRMSRYFTFVYPEKRGFEGKCLPKDINAIVKASEKVGYEPEFFADLLKNNNRLRAPTKLKKSVKK
jgi:UDPglucose 6-dehydrogenase